MNKNIFVKSETEYPYSVVLQPIRKNSNTTCTALADTYSSTTVKILKFGTQQTIAIIVLKIEKFVILH